MPTRILVKMPWRKPTIIPPIQPGQSADDDQGEKN